MRRYKCIECGHFLKFDKAANCYYCNNCGQMFASDDVLNNKEFEENSEEEISLLNSCANDNHAILHDSMKKDMSIEDIWDDDKISIKKYKCFSCKMSFFDENASIMAEHKEILDVCPYCGEKNIEMFMETDVSKPKKIIPFTIDSNKAKENVIKVFQKAKFLPRGLDKNIDFNVGAVYVPMWMISSRMSVMAGFINKKIDTKTYSRSNGFDYFQPDKSRAIWQQGDDIIGISGNDNFLNEIAVDINQYPTSSSIDFDDLELKDGMFIFPDVDLDSATHIAMNYQYNKLIHQSLIERHVLNAKYIENLDYQMKKIHTYQVDYDIHKASLYFVPIYVVSYICKGEKKYMYVNGSNGNVVGNIPTDKFKVIATNILLDVLIATCSVLLWRGLLLGEFIVSEYSAMKIIVFSYYIGPPLFAIMMNKFRLSKDRLK